MARITPETKSTPSPMLSSLILLLLIILLSSSHQTLAKSEVEASQCTLFTTTAGNGPDCVDRTKAQTLNYIGVGAILVASMVGVSLPLFSKAVPALGPEKNLFSLVKAFASGVIVATGFMHVLPDSWNDLTSLCLPQRPWRIYPIAPFITMVSVYLTMMMDTFALSYYSKVSRGSSSSSVNVDDEGHGKEIGLDRLDDEESCGGGDHHHHDHSHSHGHGHRHGHGHILRVKRSNLLKNRVVAQVLELGIVVHSVVIGLSMGASDNVCTIKPLIAAICFHQLFEGMGLGGCILQAEYGLKVKATMVFFFSITTPSGIILGILLQHVYKQNSPTSLIVEGVLNAVSAGLLIYMALVDLLAADFKGKKLQENMKLQLYCYGMALLGSGGMSLMALWA